MCWYRNDATNLYFDLSIYELNCFHCKYIQSSSYIVNKSFIILSWYSGSKSEMPGEFITDDLYTTIISIFIFHSRYFSTVATFLHTNEWINRNRILSTKDCSNKYKKCPKINRLFTCSFPFYSNYFQLFYKFVVVKHNTIFFHIFYIFAFVHNFKYTEEEKRKRKIKLLSYSRWLHKWLKLSWVNPIIWKFKDFSYLKNLLRLLSSISIKNTIFHLATGYSLPQKQEYYRSIRVWMVIKWSHCWTAKIREKKIASHHKTACNESKNEGI